MMKPYQFYVVEGFPKLDPGQSVRNEIQLTFSGENEDVETTITLERDGFDGPLALLRVQSDIRHETTGFIKTFVENKRRKINFNEYLQPVDFPAYLERDKGLLVFQAPKRACRGVLSHLRSKPVGVCIKEMEVDFVKVMEIHSEYLAAWFRGVSSRVQAAGLSGNQIQDDTLFRNLKQVASLSNVTIPWVFEGAEHPVMITSRAGVVLVQNYQDNIGLELRLIMDVYDRLLQHVWHARKSRTEDDGSPVEP